MRKRNGQPPHGAYYLQRRLTATTSRADSVADFAALVDKERWEAR